MGKKKETPKTENYSLRELFEEESDDNESVIVKASIPKSLKKRIEEDSNRTGCSQSWLIGTILEQAYEGVKIQYSPRENALASIKIQLKEGREE